MKLTNVLNAVDGNKVYRIATCVKPEGVRLKKKKKEKDRMQPKSVPSLIGSCTFVGRDSRFEIVVLIFMCS